MPEATYEILALLMRYVFVALAALICVRALRWLLRDHRAHVRERRQLPRAGQIGVLEFADSGERLPLAPEGLVGAGRSCDVVIRKRGLRQKHFSYRFQPRHGVEIIPCRGARVSVNGQKAQAGHYALSGALIQAGDTVLRLRLYKRLRLPADSGDMHDSPDPLLNAWDEDDFLPNGMGVPTPLGDEYENDYGTDGDPGPYSDDEPPDAGEWPGPQRGKILHMPRFGDEPPEERE